MDNNDILEDLKGVLTVKINGVTVFENLPESLASVDKNNKDLLIKVIEDRKYPVTINKTYINNNDTRLPFWNIKDIFITDEYVVVETLEKNLIRIDEEGFIIETYVQVKKFCDEFMWLLEEHNLLDKFINACKERGTAALVNEVIKLHKESLAKANEH